jgi:hypothetical protein
MSLAEIEKAIDELSPRELTKLAAHIARRDKLAWDKELEKDLLQVGSTKRRSRRSTPKSTQAISRRFRDFARAEVIREVLQPTACARSETRGQEFRAVQG